ncbi:MAG: glycosyltransferase family 2 protein, partial [Candidatus Binatia bacterium]
MGARVLSVIVSTHDRLAKLRRLLDCLRDQQLAADDYEVIVVDDGSTPAVTLEPRTEAPSERLIRVERCGRSMARNLGAKAARGQWLVFLDDDMTVGPSFLTAHLAALKDWHETILTGSIRIADEALSRPFPRFRQRLEDRGVPRSVGVTETESSAAAGNMAMHTRVFHRLGGFDPALSSGEDRDLALRHGAVGGRTAFVPQAVSVHHDDAMDVRSYCLRSEWGAERLVPLDRKHSDLRESVEREAVNGPLRLGREPLGLSLRKA